MANLNISIDAVFETEELITHSKITFENERLTGDKANQFFETCAKEDIALYVVAVDPNTGEANISFEFGIKSLKKSAILDVSMNSKKTGLIAKVNGKFSVKLRSGVQESLVSGTIFKLQGICCKGGSYRGFMAYLVDQNEENVKSWFVIEDAQVR